MTSPAKRNRASQEAQANWGKLSRNNYPGRFLAIGINKDGALTVVYAITGRSEGSKNRKLIWEKGRLHVAPANPEKSVGDPSLTVYDAIIPLKNGIAISNGSQTREIAHALKIGGSFEDALSTFTFEPDDPIFTSRISGLITADEAKISRIRQGDENQTVSDLFDLGLPPEGFGYAIQTYDGQDESRTVKRFMDDPYVLDIGGTPQEILQRIWSVMPQDFMVSAAVVFFDKAEPRAFVKNHYVDA